jgi:chorismate mutase
VDATLAGLRAEIDACDGAIVDAIARRRAVVEALAVHKHTLGLAPVDGSREVELEAQWRERAVRANVPEEVALEVLRALLVHSRAHVRAIVARADASHERSAK